MIYDYQTQKKELFTPQGVKVLMEVRDKAKELLRVAGAFQSSKAFTAGDTWDSMAALDWMVEQGELLEITDDNVVGQHRVFVARGGGA